MFHSIIQVYLAATAAEHFILRITWQREATAVITTLLIAVCFKANLYIAT